MRPEEDDAARVWDIVKYARQLIEMAEGRSYDEFVSDMQFRLAAERCVEIIGEAAGNVTRECRDRFPDIPWQRIVGLRNIIVDGYAELDHERLWKVIEDDVTTLIQRLAPMVDRAEPPE